MEISLKINFQTRLDGAVSCVRKEVNMTTQQLESFLAVAENLSFARAADTLNITQSAVSRQIHALENELETTLFHRTSRTVALTPSGISFYEDAKKFMGSLRSAAARLRQHSKSNIQPLSIGCSNELDCQLLTVLLKKCREELPQLHPVLRVIPHRSILSLFFQGDIDILFGYRDNVPIRDGVAYQELFQVPICCAFSAAHPSSKRQEIHMSELYSDSLVLCHSYAIPYVAASLQHSIEQNFPPDSVYYCDNLGALLTLVKAGYGFAILPQSGAADPELCYVPVAGEPPVSYGIFYKKSPQNPMVKKMAAMIQKLKN